jgi:phosphomannomutase/phosphoglucomutase
MRWQILNSVPYNSFDYFEKTLITDNGFREYDVRWILGEEINPNGFLVLGRAYGTYVQEVLGEERVVVGYDFRSYSQNLSRSLVVGLLSTGIHVLDIGLALTPMVYFAQHHLKTKGATMITASHNENGWTGIKLANGLSSTLGPRGIIEFKEIVKRNNFSTGKGIYETYDDVYDFYAKDLLGQEKLSRPLKVVLAAGNGTAGRFGPSVFKSLGCDLIEVDCDADWDFPNHNPNPEDISFLKNISETTLKHNADLGIGVDGDGDRIGVVDDRGHEIYSDKLGLLLSRWICKSHPGRTIIIDVKSTGLFSDDQVLRDTNTQVVMWKTGHSYIKQKVSELNAIAGFEKSGHFFFNEPFGRGYDDALLSAVILLRFLDDVGVSVSKMIDDLPKTWQSPTIGVFCPDKEKYQVVDDITKQFAEDYEKRNTIAGSVIKDIITVNGVRFVFENDSWGLIRASSNKPSLVLVAESRKSEGELYDIMEFMQQRLGKTGNIGDYDQQMPERTGA